MRRARLDRTGESPSAWVLSGFSRTEPSRMHKSRSPGGSASTRGCAWSKRKRSTIVACHLGLWISLARRFTPAGACHGSTSTAPSSESKSPVPRCRWRMMASTLAASVRTKRTSSWRSRWVKKGCNTDRLRRARSSASCCANRGTIETALQLVMASIPSAYSEGLAISLAHAHKIRGVSCLDGLWLSE